MSTLSDHRPGDPVRSDDVNRMNDAIRGRGRMRAGPGVVVREGSSSRNVGLDLAERIDARITGPYDSGYPWVQVYRTADGTDWVDSDRTGTAELDPAFERRSGAADLDDAPTAYQFRRAPTSGQWIFAAMACAEFHGRAVDCAGVGVEGITAQLLQDDVVIAEGTTDELGRVSLRSHVGGLTTFRWLAPSARWADKDTTINAVCGHSYGIAALGPQVADGYVCCAGTSGQPIKATLLLTTVDGTFPATFVSFGPTTRCGRWQVCYDAPALVYRATEEGCEAVEATTPVTWWINCPGCAAVPGDTWEIVEIWGGGNINNFCGDDHYLFLDQLCSDPTFFTPRSNAQQAVTGSPPSFAVTFPTTIDAGQTHLPVTGTVSVVES